MSNNYQNEKRFTSPYAGDPERFLADMCSSLALPTIPLIFAVIAQDRGSACTEKRICAIDAQSHRNSLREHGANLASAKTGVA